MPTVRKQSTRTAKKHTASKAKKGAQGSFASKIATLDDGLDCGLKFNVYGVSGTGKTTFWSTFPGKILALVCSSIDTSGELRSINTEENRNKIDKVVIAESKDVLEAVAYCKENPDEYATVVLDHASGLQELALKEILGLDEIPVQLSWGIAKQQDWGQVAVQMKEYLRCLLELPQNVVIVAQERVFDAGDGDEESMVMPHVASALSPSVTGWLNPAVDYIVQTYKRLQQEEKTVSIGGKKKTVKKLSNKTEFCLRVGPHPVYTTKFRVPMGANLPDVIIDPTYDKVVQYLN